MFVVIFFFADYLNCRLPSVPEEDVFQNNSYPDLDLMASITQVNNMPVVATTTMSATTGNVAVDSVTSVSQTIPQQQQSMQTDNSNVNLQNLQYIAKIYTQQQTQSQSDTLYRNNV